MKGFQIAIEAYLKERASKDAVFAEKFKAKCEAEKDSIKDCCNYIVGEVKKKADGQNMVGCTDDFVYGLAMHYYDENLEKPSVSQNCKVVINRELTEEEKAQAEERAKELLIEREANEIEAKIRNEKIEAKKAKEKKIEAAKKKREQIEESGQLFLF